MSADDGDSELDTLRQAAIPLTSAATDYDPILDLVGDARFVLICEASHGTHEFYAERGMPRSITARCSTAASRRGISAIRTWSAR